MTIESEMKIDESYAAIDALGLPESIKDQALSAAMDAYFHVVLTSDQLSSDQQEAARQAFINFKGKKRALVVTKRHLEELAAKGLGLQAGEDDVVIECDGDDEADAMVEKLMQERAYAIVGRVRSQDP